jgi:photosystem II stability/assembly factor-like uncharacterized protein
MPMCLQFNFPVKFVPVFSILAVLLVALSASQLASAQRVTHFPLLTRNKTLETTDAWGVSRAEVKPSSPSTFGSVRTELLPVAVKAGRYAGPNGNQATIDDGIKHQDAVIARGISAGVSADHRANSVNLVGIPGPYSFQKFCRLGTDDLWVVGGAGTVRHTSVEGSLVKQVTDEDLHGVYFVNNHTGWIVGESGSILHTEDQGGHWTRETSGVRKSLQGIKCSDESRCWVVGDEGTVLRSEGQAGGWRRFNTGTSSDLYAVDFVNSQIGWIVGEAGLILHTSDGGQSWEKQQANIILFPQGPFAKAADLLAVRFIDANRGWVAGLAGIARTLDGGKTWEATPFEDTAFIGVVSNDGEKVWAIDLEGYNFASRDGGVHWFPVANGDFAKTADGQNLSQELYPTLVDSSPPEGIKLLPGYQHRGATDFEGNQRGEISKTGGLEIKYEMGLSEGMLVNRNRKAAYVWYKEQRVDNRITRYALTKMNVLIISVSLAAERKSLHAANFYGQIRRPEDIPQMLSMILPFGNRTVAETANRRDRRR